MVYNTSRNLTIYCLTGHEISKINFSLVLGVEMNVLGLTCYSYRNCIRVQFWGNCMRSGRKYCSSVASAVLARYLLILLENIYFQFATLLAKFSFSLIYNMVYLLVMALKRHRRTLSISQSPSRLLEDSQ